jgi:membrane fusion protein (multidrug efflux system)
MKPRVFGAVFALLLVGGAPAVWLHSRHFESTDDAQIEGHLNAISARITGTVARINPNVENNHYVEAGTLLLELDPGDYDVAVAQARAALNTREATANAAGLQVPIVQASAFGQLALTRASESEAVDSVAVEEANLMAAQHRVEHDLLVAARAERDRQRYLALVEKREISRSEYDARETEAKAAAETLEADRSSVVAAQRRIAQAQSRVVQKQADVASARTAPEQWLNVKARSAASVAQVAQARADLRSAELNLSYTKIYAPVSGIVGRKTVEVGHRVQPGQALLIVVPVGDLWVTANFKETQVRLMRPGQPVDVHVDAFDRDYRGTVEEMPGAAGTLFSLLPPENASGNFVKVVQRLPVRIRLTSGEDADHRLRPGMSVETRVRVN